MNWMLYQFFELNNKDTRTTSIEVPFLIFNTVSISI